MMIEPVWWQYAIFEEEKDGGVRIVGLTANATEEARKEYEKYLKATENGVKM